MLAADLYARIVRRFPRRQLFIRITADRIAGVKRHRKVHTAPFTDWTAECGVNVPLDINKRLAGLHLFKLSD